MNVEIVCVNDCCDDDSMIQKESMGSVHQLQKEHLELEMCFHVEQNNHEKTLIEKASLLSQLELVNDSILQLQRKLDSVEADNCRMIQVNTILLS